MTTATRVVRNADTLHSSKRQYPPPHRGNQDKGERAPRLSRRERLFEDIMDTTAAPTNQRAEIDEAVSRPASAHREAQHNTTRIIIERAKE